MWCLLTLPGSLQMHSSCFMLKPVTKRHKSSVLFVVKRLGPQGRGCQSVPLSLLQLCSAYHISLLRCNSAHTHRLTIILSTGHASLTTQEHLPAPPWHSPSLPNWSSWRSQNIYAHCLISIPSMGHASWATQEHLPAPPGILLSYRTGRAGGRCRCGCCPPGSCPLWDPPARPACTAPGRSSGPARTSRSLGWWCSGRTASSCGTPPGTCPPDAPSVCSHIRPASSAEAGRLAAGTAKEEVVFGCTGVTSPWLPSSSLGWSRQLVEVLAVIWGCHCFWWNEAGVDDVVALIILINHQHHHYHHHQSHHHNFDNHHTSLTPYTHIQSILKQEAIWDHVCAVTVILLILVYTHIKDSSSKHCNWNQFLCLHHHHQYHHYHCMNKCLCKHPHHHHCHAIMLVQTSSPSSVLITMHIIFA